MDRKNLMTKFEKAGLALELLDTPLQRGRGMDDIFQMDISRLTKGTRRYEKFRIYPGNDKNLIQVRDEDKSHKQLLLMVREPAHEFEEVVRLSSFRTRAKVDERIATMRPKPVRVRYGVTEIAIVSKTPEQVRYMLLGVDERQLFVAQLTGPATTVAAARSSLGKTVEFASGKRKGSALDRQGEWFFLDTSPEVRTEIAEAIRKTRTTIQHKASIGAIMGRRGGNAHTADEIVKMPNVAEILLRGKVFVRGKVRHVDHKTVTFLNWREVVMNSEGETASGSASGVFWID